MLGRVRWTPLKNRLIETFCRKYQVDLAEAVVEDPKKYPTFNHFFSRALKPGARAISDGATDVVSPADGAISEVGKMRRGSLIQAKGILYSAKELLADDILGAQMESGSFITVYLSPRDYHRVHVPLAGRLLNLTYVPGKLFSVNQETARSLDGLFSNNERIVAEFETDDFTYALVMVGAMIVGGIETRACGAIKRQAELTQLHIDSNRLFKTGEEFGRFFIGSTAIAIFPKEAGVVFSSQLNEGSMLLVGSKIAEFKSG